MSEETKLDPLHASTRRTLRMLGPILAGIGLLLMIIGIGSFFASFGSFQPPRFFWCAFLGAPLLFVGLVICGFAFQGAVLRYQVGEVAPVAKDAINYMAEGTQEGVKTFAAALGEGLAAGMGGSRKADNRCPKCSHSNDADAKFCKNCGIAFADTPMSRWSRGT
ncbi:MAG: zinc-ribbon domain-containing protein [Thermoguttaceae bacterium]